MLMCKNRSFFSCKLYSLNNIFCHGNSQLTSCFLCHPSLVLVHHSSSSCLLSVAETFTISLGRTSVGPKRCLHT